LALRIAPHLDALTAAHVMESPAAGPPLRVGGPADLLATFVVPSVAPAVSRGLRVQSLTCDDHTVLDLVADGELDLSVTVGAVTHKGVAVTPLFDKQVVLVGTTRWTGLLTGDALDRQGPDALRAVPVIAYSRDLRVIDIYFNALFGRPPVIEPALVIDDLRAVTAAVRAGAGVSVLPWYYVREDLRSGQLVELHQPHRRPTEPVVASAHPAASDPRLPVVLEALTANRPDRDPSGTSPSPVHA
jgi:DNA-binding transcriptional LysR family regulator